MSVAFLGFDAKELPVYEMSISADVRDDQMLRG